MNILRLLSAFVLSSFIGGLATQAQSQEDLSWTTERWQRKDVYESLRSQLNTEISRSKSYNSLVQKYRFRSEQRRQDPNAFFKFAYANFRYAQQTQKKDERQFRNILQRFSQYPPQGSYEFTRLRFIYEALNFATPKLRIVGIRLLDRNTRDLDVNYHIINTLNIARADDHQLALTCAKRLVKLAPHKANSHATLGWVYFRAWSISKNQQEARLSLNAYNRYLQLAKPQEPFRPQAQRIVAMLKREARL